MKRLFLVLLKFTPAILSIICVLNDLFYLANIDGFILNTIGGVSIIPILFFLVSSYLFQFCSYHRVFIYYLFVNQLFTILDWIFVFALNVKYAIFINILLFLITFFVALYKYFQENEIKVFKRGLIKSNK